MNKDATEILIVEDSATQAARLQYMLEQNGFTVVAATNGREALTVLETRTPSLIISDIVMPELDGYGLCSAVRAEARWKEIPIILVTTLADAIDVVRGLECGADNFVRKPYEERYLLSRINYLLMNRELRKNQRMQMGLEINLHGQRHFITSERQQILDLLISTYEQAIEIGDELKLREQELWQSNQTLNGLYRLAEGLNRVDSEQKVAELALDRILDLPGAQAGWIFLRKDDSSFRLAAARNLPPALAASGTIHPECACLRRLVAGELDSAINIFECDRLQQETGDTGESVDHAAIPLWLGERTLGVINLIGPGSGRFDDQELKVLYGVGNQVAVALERAHLHDHLERLVDDKTAHLRAEIARRKEAEQQLRESEERYRSMFDLSPHPLWVYDSETLSFLAVNQAAIQLYGFSREDFARMSLADIRPVDQVPELMRTLEENEGAPAGRNFGVFKHVKQDGTVIDVEVASSAIAFAGRPARLVLAMDVTERLRLEQERRLMERRLEQVERVDSLGRVAATVAHEFNNVLMGILPFAEVVRRTVTDERALKAAESIARSVRRGKRITEEILRFTKPSEPQMESMEMTQWLSSIEPELRGFTGAGIEFEAQVPDEPLIVHCDAAQMQQVLTNLVINARDALPDGGSITLSLARATAERSREMGLPEDERFIELIVRDSGPGLAPEMLERVFEPLFTTKRSGTGLGLAVARQVVTQHGGLITAERPAGVGTAFHIVLPESSEQGEAPNPRQAPSAGTRSAPGRKRSR